MKKGDWETTLLPQQLYYLELRKKPMVDVYCAEVGRHIHEGGENLGLFNWQSVYMCTCVRLHICVCTCVCM